MTSAPDPTHPEPAPELALQISPEPTDDERDALVAAVAILISEPVAALTAGQTQAAPSRWARTGRDAAFAARRIRRGWRDP